MLGGIDRQNEVVRARNLPYKVRLPTREILTTLAFWLRSSVVSVLNSLTTITEAPPLVFGYLIFAALVLRALLATRGRDDLAIAVSACVVGGIPFFHFLSAFIGHPLFEDAWNASKYCPPFCYAM